VVVLVWGVFVCWCGLACQEEGSKLPGWGFQVSRSWVPYIAGGKMTPGSGKKRFERKKISGLSIVGR